MFQLVLSLLYFFIFLFAHISLLLMLLHIMLQVLSELYLTVAFLSHQTYDFTFIVNDGPKTFTKPVTFFENAKI